MLAAGGWWGPPGLLPRHVVLDFVPPLLVSSRIVQQEFYRQCHRNESCKAVEIAPPGNKAVFLGRRGVGAAAAGAVVGGGACPGDAWSWWRSGCHCATSVGPRQWSPGLLQPRPLEAAQQMAYRGDRQRKGSIDAHGLRGRLVAALAAVEAAQPSLLPLAGRLPQPSAPSCWATWSSTSTSPPSTPVQPGSRRLACSCAVPQRWSRRAAMPAAAAASSSSSKQSALAHDDGLRSGIGCVPLSFQAAHRHVNSSRLFAAAVGPGLQVYVT